MVNRIAGILALVAFAMTSLVGVVEARNPFGTVVWRALLAMFGTYVVGYLIGLAAERMLSEHLAEIDKRLAAERAVKLAEREKLLENVQESATDGR